MGSKSACIIFEDANYPLAVEAAVASAYKLSGQRCVSSGRLLVQRSIIDNFVHDFSNMSEQIETGPPFISRNSNDDDLRNPSWQHHQPNSDAYYGPLINKQALEKVVKYNEMVSNDPDTTVLLRGAVQPGEGYFMTPTVYQTEWRDVPFLKNEVFGPHVAIIPFDTVEDAIRIYNDTDYGLAVGVLTNNFKTARKCRDECEYGMCYWNGGSIAAESHLAFGGVKKSGNGYPSAARTYQAVTHEVSWTVNHGDSLSFPQGMTK